MTDCRFSRLLTKLEIPLLLAVPAVMATALLAGVEQAALAMLVVVALVLALFFAGYEASRPGLRQIMPTLVLAALAAAGRILFGPIPDFKPVSAIAIIGNSITDGKCSTDNAQNRWPDVMSEMLQLKHKITNQGVLNLGIGNNRVTVPGGFGALAKERFDRDILMQSGVKKVVIFEGVNDIGAARSGSSETVARQIIESIHGMVKKAKARKMKVYLGTITPFKGAGYYTHFHEAARLYVNDWIRSQAKNVDGILDFAKLLQDPNDDRRMKREYASNDWLHPNPTGYKAMGIYAADIVK